MQAHEIEMIPNIYEEMQYGNRTRPQEIVIAERKFYDDLKYPNGNYFW
jgi:hypothetical protein